MASSGWQAFRSLPRFLGSSPDPRQQEWRIEVVERNVGLPVKTVVLGILFYYLFLSRWMTGWTGPPEQATRRFAQDVVQYAFLVYVAVNVGVAFLLVGMRQVSSMLIEWAVFTSALIDSLFLGAMILITGGLDSTLYWLYLVLVVRNSISIGATVPQLLLNLVVCLVYMAAVMLDAWIATLDRTPAPDLGKPFLLRVFLLFSVAAWCYGMRVLLDKQFRNIDELRELAVRREQLEASGRLAAEIAHQLKNPLGVINNAAFTLQRTVKEGKTITQQIRIIREEVERSDRIITELMGYAQLAEGRVEKLEVQEELERAILQVFPPAVKYEVQIHRDYAPALPQLLAQRNHLAEVFINLLQNAREAMNGRGNLWVSTAYGDNYSVVVTIADDGPGIAAEHLPKIFAPYFTTREKGTGLGLAIVKHNTEIYGGKVWVESELGQPTKFIVQFPARTLMKLRK